MLSKRLVYQTREREGAITLENDVSCNGEVYQTREREGAITPSAAMEGNQ